MKKILVLLGILIFLSLMLTSCTKKEDADLEQTPGLIKGVSLSPKSFLSSDFTDFFDKAKQVGNAVSWAGDWNELGNLNNGGPKVVTELASTYDYIPIVEAQFFTQSDGKMIRYLDETTKQTYKNAATAFAEKYKPKYMGFGIEVNILYEKSPQDFESFVSFYNELYDSVKIKSPDTKIFTIFQLEKMKGLNGGLFGGVNDAVKNQWFLLERFKADITAFTTYPGLIYKDPTEIPNDYYLEIASHTSKPIAFTEIGWHSSSSPAGWESSEEEQAEFVALFFDLTKNLDSELLIWSFLYDQDTIEPFNSMGLINKNGDIKPAFNQWNS